MQYAVTGEAGSEAFRAFASDFPGRTTFLLDTYDTLNGARTAVDVIRELDLEGRLAVRLDSGDLEALSRQVRVILDEAGLRHVRIFASGGLDELRVAALVQSGAPIDAFGVGTQLGVSADAPTMDSVYKIVRYGDRPVLKLSPEKATLPGEKQVFRGAGGDVLALRGEPGGDGARPLLEPVMEAGRRTRPPPTLSEGESRLAADLSWLPAAAKRLEHPTAPTPRVSRALAQLADRTRAEARTRLRRHDTRTS